MKTLLILRHAKSSWKDAKLADHDRPLKKRGRRDAPRMGALLRQEELLPDLILSSSAERARTTAMLVAEESGYDGEVMISRDLYAFEAGAYYEALAGLPPKYERVLVVGHNPGLEELLESLCGEYERMPTAALALVRLPIRSWGELDEQTQGDLVDIWRPKEI